jgi:hypothetical protein
MRATVSPSAPVPKAVTAKCALPMRTTRPPTVALDALAGLGREGLRRGGGKAAFAGRVAARLASGCSERLSAAAARVMRSSSDMGTARRNRKLGSSGLPMGERAGLVEHHHPGAVAACRASPLLTSTPSCAPRPRWPP